jgi:Holliday junction DNA helicase RuvA
MIAFLEGVVDSKGVDYVVLNVGGIGFHVKTSSRPSDEIGSVGSEAVLHTCFMIREENPVLFGFDSTQERAVFLDLVSVSGVGPRVALALLSALRPGDLATAIVCNDTELLSKIPGVGKKTAARLCVDLSTRMESYVGTSAGAAHPGDAELVEALMALGYTAREAVDAARKVEVAEGVPLEQRIKRALGALAGR